ncbi:MAG: RibD family protein [Candidatus Altiarchaeota archaeon]
MPQPYVILTAKASLDGRMDVEHPVFLFNRLEDYRVQELRGTVDAVLTSAARVAQDDPEFPAKDSTTFPPVVIIDKGLETPAKARVLKNARKVILATCKSSNKFRLKPIQDVKPDVSVLEVGENAVNLEDLLWELHRAGMQKTLLEGDVALNMRMLGYGLVDELYVMVAPLMLGQTSVSVFDGKLERNIELQLDGILQYGDHVVLHYMVDKNRR